MKLLKKIGSALLIFIALFFSQQALAKETPSLSNEKDVKQFVDKQMNEDLEKFHIPGAVISIVKDQKLVYSSGYGMQNVEKNEKVEADSSMFRIASTTKLFTWTAAMQLVEEGKIDLNTDINTYLTSVKIPDTFDKPITMKDLMTHTAGFEEGGVGYQITTDTKKLDTTIAETLNEHPLKRVREAGKAASYSNYGTALAGLIVEDVNGMPYTEYIQKNIFDVLDMKHATVVEPLPEKFEANKVIGYNYKDGQFVAGTPTYEGGFAPAGAASVAGNDMATFMLAHLNNGTIDGKQLLKPETTELMHKTAFQFDKRLPGSTLGFQEGEINGYKTISHAGADTMFITDLYLVPDQKVGIFLSYSGGEADAALASMRTAFFDQFLPSIKNEEPKFIKTTEKELDNYTGSFKFTRRNSSHIDKFFSLLVEMKVNQKDGQLVMGEGDEQEVFEKIDDNLFQQVGGQQKLAFKTNKSGKATEMLLSIMPDMPLEKTKFWDQSLVWFIIIGTYLAILFIALVTILVRIKKVNHLHKKEKNTIWVLLATAISAIITMVLLVTNVLNMDVLQRLSEVTLGLKLFLFLPLLVGELSVVLLVRVGIAWYKKEFSLSIRILLTIALLAAVGLTFFFIHWNLIGWHFG